LVAIDADEPEARADSADSRVLDAAEPEQFADLSAWNPENPNPENPNRANPENREPAEPAEPEEPGALGAPVPADPLPDRYRRLGGEGLARLRSRYVDVKSRLEAKPLEEPERTELFARVERLNPDAWLTPDEVAAALEDYESVFESLRAIVGRQPRRHPTTRL
jgi:hypothetical protein